MSFDPSRKSIVGKRTTFCFLAVSLFFHIAILVFLADTEREREERPFRVEVGLVSLPSRMAGERSAQEARPRTAAPAGEPAPVPPSDPAVGEREEAIAADISDAAPVPFPPCSGKERVPAGREPSAEPVIPAEKVVGAFPISPGAGQAQEPVLSSEKGKADASVPFIEATPRYDRNAPPPYPHLARERGWEGDVLLRVLVSRTGDVHRVSVERSSGHEVLDAAALRAVRRWRFHPSRLGATPVEAEVLVPVRFKLRDS